MTTPSSSPIAEDRAAWTFASPHCTACHLPHSSTLSSTKRGLCGSSRDLQRRVGLPHALGLRSIGTRAEAILDDPGAAIPDATAGVGATALDAAGPIDDLSARVAVSVVVAAAVIAFDARPALFAAATVSVVATGGGIPISTATADSVAAAGAGVAVSAAAVVSAAAAGAGVPISAVAAVSVVATGACASISTATISAVAVAVGAPSVADGLDAGASPASFSAASSSRSITSPGGGTPGAAPLPVGSAAEAEGRTGDGSCPMPDCGTFPPVAAAEAASAGGPAASQTTPSLATGGVPASLAEVVDTQSVFFGASGRDEVSRSSAVKQQQLHRKRLDAKKGIRCARNSHLPSLSARATGALYL
nr:elastin-like [Setaria viridis]